MEKFGSFKELYDVNLKATYNIEIGDRVYVPGEVITRFDKIQVAGLQENIRRVKATGGYENRTLVVWESLRDINLSFVQGVFSMTQFALLSNSRVFNVEEDEGVLVSRYEELETNEEGKVKLKNIPNDGLFVYNKSTGEKITNYVINENELTISDKFMDIVVTYNYLHKNGQVVKLGQNLLSGFLELEGKTRVKDDTTGQTVTGIIRIPKLKLVSDLSIRLGTSLSPISAQFNAIGVPVGSRGSNYVSELILLDNDIDSDF